MPSIGNPLWLLAPLFALAIMALGRRHLLLPGAWDRAIGRDLQPFMAASIERMRTGTRVVILFCLWLFLGAALATISLGLTKIPKLRNLDARVVVIDLGLPGTEEERIAAARYLIDRADDVPTAVIAVTRHAFDVVPLTRDDTHLDRYLQVLSGDIMPVEGRSLLTGIERAVALLDRAGIQARQITVFTGGSPPAIARFQKPDRTEDHNIWLVLPDDPDAAWQAFANDLDANLVDNQETFILHEDFEERRRDVAAKAVSIRERRDLTPWLIAFILPLWLWLFFRRQAA